MTLTLIATLLLVMSVKTIDEARKRGKRRDWRE